VWTADYPEEFRRLFPAAAGYIFHRGDANTPYQKGYYAVTESKRFDFQDSARTERRGLLVGELDALGHESSVVYDSPYSLLPIQMKDPAGLITKAEHDYRLLRPRIVTDPNGNRRFATYTPLGQLATLANMGKVTETVGDTEAIPGATFTYDFSSLPISTRTEQRVFHANDTSVDPAIKNQTTTTVEYSDGFGRVVQTRITAPELLFGDPVFGGGVVPANQSDPNSQALVVGRLNTVAQNPNVIVSGWQLYDNKGQVTRKFEPFFSTGWQYSAPTQAQLGQSSTLFYDPKGRVIRTVNPDGSEHRVVYGVPGTRTQPNLSNPDIFDPTPWESYVYDANDNAGRTHAAQSTGYQEHWNTPASSLIDALGRTVRGMVRNGSNPATDWFAGSSTYDISGNLIEARDELGRVVARTVYDLANRPLRKVSLDGGEKVVVINAAGSQIEGRDSKGALTLNSYDVMNRAIRIWARDNSASSLTLRQRMVYGDHPDSGLASPQSLNLLGQLFRHYDEAGLLTNERFDFKGNTVESMRQAIRDSEIVKVLKTGADKLFQIDWQPAPGTDLAARAAVLLDPVTYRGTSTFDAMNRIQTMLYPFKEVDRRATRAELRVRYNRAGSLEQVTLDGVVYVKHIAYNAKGERTLIAYGNGVLTRYAYDPLTLLLSRLRSEKYTSPAAGSFQPAGPALQDNSYVYDLIGNVLQIVERTPGSGVLNNPDAGQVQDAALAQLLVQGNALIRRFTYDPIYRLLSGSGRECSNIPSPRPWSDDPRCGAFSSGKKPTPDPDNAPSVTSIYQEHYNYDPAGNMVTLKHVGKSATWVRNFGMGGMTPQQWAAEWPKHLGPLVWANPPNNRLTHVGDNQTAPPQTHSYDACGNLTSETTSRRFEWDYTDRLRGFRVQPQPGAAASVQAQYLYDAAGQRVKKLVLKQDGTVASTVYVGGIFEHHSWTTGPAGENLRLHIMDNQKRIAMVRVGPASSTDQAPEVQFQLGDHLGSSSVVVDNAGTSINREEYTPYGETTFGSFAMKRYRFTGKERDEESGLYYHGARYYAPWIVRWASCDPLGTVDGLNLYAYVRNNPLVLVDPKGTNGENATQPQVDCSRGCIRADNRTEMQRDNDHMQGKMLNIEFQTRNDKNMTWDEFMKMKRFEFALREGQYVNNLGGSIAYTVVGLWTGDSRKAMDAAKLGSLIDEAAQAAAQVKVDRYVMRNMDIGDPFRAKPITFGEQTSETSMSMNPKQFEEQLITEIVTLGFYAQSMVKGEKKEKTHGVSGTVAHSYYEWMSQDMVKEAPLSFKNGSDVYTLHTEEFRDVNGDVVGRREVNSLGLDTVLYKNGEPFLGLDLKTGRAWSTSQYEAVVKRFGFIPIIQFGLDNWKTK
jgi:RHS repeat-associated protein